MKAIKYSLIGLALVAAGLSSCQDSYDAPELQTPVATMKPNTTLLEFKEFIQEMTTLEGTTALVVPEKENGEHYIIHGRVVSCDASGNIYQSLVIQDETTAFNLSIREGNMWSYYRIGQDVVIDATGLYMGLYNGLYQLGWLGEYNKAPSLTFMGWYQFRQHNQLNGLPNGTVKYIRPTVEWPAENPYCLVFKNIGEISSFAGGNMQLMSQLVEIQNVSFVDAGVETFAPYQESVSRTVKDANGNELTVRNSGYSNFYNEILPEGTGTVRGILSYYNGWQLLLRDIDDVIFGDLEGDTQDTALTVSEAIAQENSGRSMWVKGYVVGSVKGGVSMVKSNDDIIFGPDAQVLNNVVIAESPEVKDYQQCMIVELGANTAIRQYVNLVENPGVYGKLLYVNGALEEYLGLSGITGTDKDFEYEGMDLSGGDGLGSQASPFSVDYVLSHPEAQADVWVEGYIVGFVNGGTFATGATFGLPNDDSDYNNANIVISSSATGATVTTSIPVRLSDRSIGLKNAPANLGKKVKFQGNIGTYLGATGLSETTQFVLE